MERDNLVEAAEYLLMNAAGLHPTEPQEEETARRFVKALVEMTTPQVFDFTTFDVDVDQMIVMQDIPFASLCRHHVFPFMGMCHVGYVSDGRIAGLSKIPRLVAADSAGLRTQEELTDMIAEHLEDKLKPKGVVVMMIAQHSCMTLRGAKSPGSTSTMSVKGVFADHSRTAKMEFLERIRK